MGWYQFDNRWILISRDSLAHKRIQQPLKAHQDLRDRVNPKLLGCNLPGQLFLLSNKTATPIVCWFGCWRYMTTYVAELVLILLSLLGVPDSKLCSCFRTTTQNLW